MSLLWCRFIKHLTPSTTVLYDVCDRFLQVMCSLRAAIINILGWAQQCEPPVDAKVPFPTHSFSKKWKVPGISELCLEEINICSKVPTFVIIIRSKRVLFFKGGIGARAQPESNYILGCLTLYDQTVTIITFSPFNKSNQVNQQGNDNFW